MIRHLAESDNYKVTSEYEYATLHFKNYLLKKSVHIGDFYGDPDCAIISSNEKYLVIAGCGLIIYKLEEPFIDYCTDKDVNQYSVFFTDPQNTWWVEKLHQTDTDSNGKFFRFFATNNDGESLYKMNAETFQIERLESH